MKLNEHIVVKGNQVLLVPYEAYHVAKYHEWMKSEDLQVLTASEPLTLDEEYQMQKTWRTDPDIKECTFIVLDKKIHDETNDEVSAMIGDTNFFLKEINGLIIAEVEIMIAEESARGRGLGKESLLLMLRYGVENLAINMFEAKIGMSNNKSISLFTKIGFQKVDENRVFDEVTFQKEVTDAWTQWLVSQTQFYIKQER